jgi:hypothetical protein
MAKSKPKEADPAVQLAGIVRGVEQDGAPRAAFLKGEERYFIDRALECMVAAAAARGDEVCKHDTADPDFQLGVLLDDLGASPLFATSRCIVVRGVDAIAKKVESGPSPFTRSAVAFLKSEREGCLFVTGKSIRADHAIAKAVKACEGVFMNSRKLYDSPPPWNPDQRDTELALWVRRRAGELGVRLSPEDAVYVAAATGNDLSGIETQLDKVRRGGSTAVRELIGWDAGGNPWKVADDLLGGDPARGLAAVEALFRGGFHSDRDGKTEISPGALSSILFNALRSKARQALVGSRAIARGGGLERAEAEAGVSGQPRAKQEFARVVGVRTWDRWQAIYDDLTELERRSRTGSTVGVDDFCRLALCWRAARRSAAGAGRGRR